ncbi:hypothetical protein [Achromobacter aegrifaciens]|uniref:hypothetical protein n=1 Tax=Achromobacter aegrifaciens TaxID=1287736 RepID=UPI0014688EEA|nr:hypothetical protein [Achromobacter aegrifaciens]CAB3709740.1 hypothetical protein LMG26852_05670 [Achromobacter aegrifaciens]
MHVSAFHPAQLQITRNEYAYPAMALTGTLSDLGQIVFDSTSKLDQYQKELLHSDDDNQAVLGYASALFWGHVSGQDRRLRSERALGKVLLALNGVDRIVKGKPQRMRGANDFGIDVVARHIRDAKYCLQTDDYASALKTLNCLPQLKIAFSSKVCAFLAPEKCGVIDSVIAEKFPQFGFEVAEGFVKSNVANLERYKDYCLYLQHTAQVLNDSDEHTTWTDRDGTQHAWRALDVERALYA